MGMNSTNASDDDGTARMLAAPQRDGFHTPTQTAANAFSTSTALANIQHTQKTHTRWCLTSLDMQSS